MDSVFLWIIVAIVVLLIAAAFAGRRGTIRKPPTDGATPYDRPSGLHGPGGAGGPFDLGGGGG